MDETARLTLPFIAANQALKHITHNEALLMLDALVQPVVETSGTTTPPPSPMEGDAHIVPGGATGAWSGHTGEIAAFQSGGWRFYDPAQGWLVYDRGAAALKLFDGSAWISIAAPGSGLGQLGINTSADDTNRLALASGASLFTHAGSGHQLKINKSGDSDSGSVLFQSNWTGYAEMGLMGDRNWRIKTSPDGSAWTDAITITAATGVVTMGGSTRPASDNAHTLGASGARWSAVWSATGTIQTSDARLKTEIAPTDLGLDFILSLNPVRFRWLKDDGQVHYGLIAQEVAVAAGHAGAAGFGGHVLGRPGDAESPQALRYDQFIAPLIAAVQTLAARVAVLEAEE
ncbi:MAG: DUF2793 domain-containing protein [Devosia sp.]|uniref:DUF2793 domain-containing protein n=1 Tax=Devosia sp. TaxID=1871048 RepID=UPI0024C5812C|nr:DUF2793 domain-containing protein [Devosia sp.]UYN99232.1 MAG: DUF2793 domain-containing protein [Devosia sp.]